MFFFVCLIVCWCLRYALEWSLTVLFNRRFPKTSIEDHTPVASNDEIEIPTNQTITDPSQQKANEGVQFRSQVLLNRVVGGVGLLLFIFHIQWATAWICSSVIEKLLNYKEQSLPEWRMNQATRQPITNQDPRPMSHLFLMFLLIQVIYCLCLLEYSGIHVLRDMLPVYALKRQGKTLYGFS